MTDSNNIYTKYNIDVNRLTRDYQKFPIKKIPRKNHGGIRYEDIPKEDFIYLYIECNLPRRILTQYLNTSIDYITKIGKMYGIKKSTEQMVENTKKTHLERYGVEYYSQTEEWNEKSKQTCLKHFGVEHPVQSPIIQEKMKQTCLKNHGVEHPLQSPIIQEKTKQTCMEHFGVENPFQSPIVQEKYKQTCLDRYGAENTFQVEEFKEKAKQTCMEHFGVEYSTQSPIVREKAKQTCLEHFGVEYYSQTDDFKNLYKDEEFVKQMKQKEYETKKKNDSFSKSEEENKIYDLLITKFKEVNRQYKSELYPFRCDFYIPEIDLYIEYQGYWTHGNEPYLGTDEQNELINEWKNESLKKPQYLDAINIWTARDPLKRDTAKQNNLNWIEFFTMKEFTQWFETI